MRAIALLISLSLASFALAEYWVTWEGDCLPEEQGWTRVWGDWSGQYHGTGATRTIADGVMTMDSLYDLGVYDLARMHRPIDPGPGETFVAEWRLSVDAVVGGAPLPRDPVVCIYSDQHTVLAFEYSAGGVQSAFEPDLFVPLTPGTFNSFRVESSDMQSYTFFVNGAYAFGSDFRYSSGLSEFAWGDSCQGAASLAHWDYVRFGAVVPEPSTAVAVLVVACLSVKRSS